MTEYEEFIKNIEKEIPIYCSVLDLINLGIFKSAQSAQYARRRQKGPDYVVLSGRNVMYTKEAVLKYLKSGEYHENSNSRISCCTRSTAGC